ncbi:MAG: spore germination protein [Oscillospiraceae bacterium]|nr:spore germination protein [Oscillospiraceae bacterium]
MVNTEKITTKQAYILFMLAAFSPLIRMSSVYGARLGGRAGWVSIFVACAAFYGFIILLGSCFKRQGSVDLYALYKSAFGRILAKVIVVIYAVWVFMLAGFYLRGFADKFKELIMPGVHDSFFTITLLALVFIILSGRLRNFAILSELFFYVVLFALAVILVLQIPKIRPENLLPVTQYDFHHIVRGTLPALGVFAYITPLLFLGAADGGRAFKKHGLYSAGVLLAANLIIFTVTTGIFGKDLTAVMEQPFIMSVKIVGAQGMLERLESVFLLLWVVTDLAVIVMLTHIFLKITGLLTEIKRPEILRSPLLLGVYVISLFFGKNTYNITSLSEKYGLWVSLILGFGIPLVAVGVIAVIHKKKISNQAFLPLK